MSFDREPVRLIGIIATAILAALSVFVTGGVINEALAGQITDTVNAVAQLAAIFAPIIAAEIARRQVTPVATPNLEAGTKVTVSSSDGEKHTTVL